MGMAQQQIAAPTFNIDLRAKPATLVSLTVLATILTIVPAAQTQTFQVIHNFTGGATGYYPIAGIVRDQAGNLYGVTAYGGNYTSRCNYQGTQTGCGVVYKITQHGSGWIFDVLSSFDGANGYAPQQLITLAPDGNLYSTTAYGGPGSCNFFPGCGTIFQLRPPATFCRSVACPWTVSDLHQFLGEPTDGSLPTLGSLTTDSAGNLYGTTETGGAYNRGTVYELSPTANGWTQSVLFNFYGPGGQNPEGGVVIDSAGNLYGVATQGGEENAGVVYQLIPEGSGWGENVLHSFNDQSDGATPTGNPIIDASGNLYGTTTGNANGGGTVWKLTPANGTWNYSVVYSFSGSYAGPVGGLLMDAAGNLYGASRVNGWGNVFKLSSGNRGWSYTSLHEFTGGSDGGWPSSNLAIDSAGNLFGEAGAGGSQNCPTGCGLVFEITP
jgi:uncharacterized repeat protein (TIGR03803 family)